MSLVLPPLPERAFLADLCREVAESERLQPHVIEKDFYLTRLLWALGQELRDQLLLKGGTLLSKVDLGFLRMSEDADFIIPGQSSSASAPWPTREPPSESMQGAAESWTRALPETSPPSCERARLRSTSTRC